ncbi:annexin A5 [Ctenodactylus gundi]
MQRDRLLEPIWKPKVKDPAPSFGESLTRSGFSGAPPSRVPSLSPCVLASLCPCVPASLRPCCGSPSDPAPAASLRPRAAAGDVAGLGKHNLVSLGKKATEPTFGSGDYGSSSSVDKSVIILSNLVLRGTVTDFPGFDDRADAETLRKAMKGLGTDEETILTLLTSRSNAQRQQIAEAFKTLFGRDLLDDLKSELTGKFEKLIVALMKPSRLYDAYELKHALKGAGTNEKVLTEIIASRTPEELRAIKEVYEEEYGSSLEDDVVGDTSGYYQRMLVVLLQANRDLDAGIDEAQVEQDAQALFQAGELKWGTDEEKFITIFGTRSVSHLRRVFDKYMTISGFQIEETIDRETSGNLEQLLLAVVKSIRSIPAYLAETLYYAMKGAGTDDHTLIRVMVSRSEIDLLNIRKEFRKNFATSLYSMVKGDTSGDYKKALLLLCGEED